MKKGIMSVIIAAGMSVGVFAQNYNTQPTQPNFNSQPNVNPGMPNQNGTPNNPNSNTGSTYSTNPMNPIPGSAPDVNALPQTQPTQPGTNYQLNSNNNGINNPNAGTPYEQNTARGQQNMGPQNRPNTNMNQDLNSGTPGAGDSLLRDQSRLNGPRAPFEDNGYEPGFLNFNNSYDTVAGFYALANMPDPPTKNNKKMSKNNTMQSTETESAKARALKEKDKTANAVPDWVKANVEAREARQRQTATCYLNNELANKPGNFKEKKDFNGGELYLSREKDGEEKVKFNNGTEFYRYEKTEKGKEKLSYGVTKDYETMELKKNDDGTAEILYHGVFPSVEDAESAIMDGIVVEEMGNVCRGVYRE